MRNLLLTSILLVGSLQATTVVKLDFEQLSRMATNVVAGKIVNITPEVDPDTGFIFSNVEIALTKSAASNFLPGRFTFRMVGGETDTKRLYIAGMPQFHQGEEVVLFLSKQTRAAITPTVGLWQGIFYVERDSATGGSSIVDHQHRPVKAVRDGRLVRGISDDAKATSRSLSETTSDTLSVDQFFQEVRRYRTLGNLANSQ